MKCILMYMIDRPEINYHICDPEEIQNVLDGHYDESTWDWYWDEI